MEDNQPSQKRMWCDCGKQAIIRVIMETGTGEFAYDLCEGCYEKEEKQRRGE